MHCRTRYHCYFLLLAGYLVLTTGIACKKLIGVDTPANEYPADQVFANDQMADAAVADVYYVISSYFTGNMLAIINGMTADELNTLNTSQVKYVNNAIPANDQLLLSCWRDLYKAVYRTNAVLEGLKASNGVSAEKVKQLTGEAKFLRAFCYYYLVNLWGDVPLLTTTDVNKTAMAPRAPVAAVYGQIAADLEDARSLLEGQYSSNEKVRANRWAAVALLARVYLDMGRWADAEEQASMVIGSGMYTPMEPLGNVFLKGSRGAILQLWRQDGYTLPGQTFIPSSASTYAFYPCADNLVNALDSNDQRKAAWMNTFTYAGNVYHYPFKYKQRSITTGSNAEYLVVLRVAEQYLIRAEARARQDNQDGAVADLNVTRGRAGLAGVPTGISRDACLLAIEKERQIELFTEWGLRWIHLKHAGRMDAVLGALKPSWQPTDSLYPIPQQERDRNPNLTQNKGYQ